MSLRERLDEADDPAPAPHEREDDQQPGFVAFELVYRRSDEVLYELSNSTVYALMHLGWVQCGEAPVSYAPQMAVYVKHRGLFGRLYMGAIAPFRHLIVYPAMMKRVSRAWQAHRQSVTQPSA